MPFFHKKNKKGVKESETIHNICSPNNVINNEKKASLAVSTAKLKAGLTLEAALTLPLFIAATFVVMFFISAINTQIRIQKALLNQTMKISGYSYYLNVVGKESKAKSLLSEAYIKSQVIKEVGKDYLKKSFIIDGEKGVHLEFKPLAGSSILEVELVYAMEVPYNLFSIHPIYMTSKAKCRTWIGLSDEDRKKQKQLVYVTEKGTVYHTDTECTYIKKQVSSCKLSAVGNKRNVSGAKYYPCDVCSKKNDATIVFYTKYGTRYHNTINCKNLKTSVYSIALDEAKKRYSQCTKCKRSGNGG